MANFVQRRKRRSRRKPSKRDLAIRAAAKYNRKNWGYSRKLIKMLYEVSANRRAYLGAPRQKYYGSYFVWLVGDAQRDLGQTVDGRFSRKLMGAVLQDRADAISSGPLTWLLRQALKGAIWIIKRIPAKKLGLTGPIAGLVKQGTLGFLSRIARIRSRKIARMIKNVARALTSWKFIKSFGYGFYRGFIHEGLLGIVTPIWDLRKAPWQMYMFAKKMYTALGDGSVSRAAKSLYKQANDTAVWLRKNWHQVFWSMVAKARNPNNPSVIELFKKYYAKAEKAVNGMGGRIAGKIENFFSGNVRDIGATLGRLSGTASGFITFETIVGVLTAGASVAFTSAKLVLKPVTKALAKGFKYVVRYAGWIMGKFTTWFKAAGTAISRWLVHLPRGLATRVRQLVDRLGKFFNKLMARLKGGRRRKPGKKGKKPEKKKPGQVGDGEVGETVHFPVGDERHKLWLKTSALGVVPFVSSDPKPVSEQLAAWKKELKGLPKEKQRNAGKLLKVARKRLKRTTKFGKKAAKLFKKAKLNRRSRRLVLQFTRADDRAEREQRKLGNTLQKLFGIFSSGIIVELPFTMAKHKHTLFVEKGKKKLRVSMASAKRREISDRYNKVKELFNLYEKYIKDTRDEDLKQKAQEVLDMIKLMRDNNIDEFTDKLEKKESGVSKKSILDEATADAQKLVGELTEFAGETHQDLTPEAVRLELDRRAKVAREKAWKEKQAEVLNVLSSFDVRVKALASDAKLKLRGSLVKGYKTPKEIGPGKEPLDFDPSSFDVDAYIQSDILFARAEAAGASFRPGDPGAFVGSQSKIPAFQELVKDIRKALTVIAGNRDVEGKDFQFNVLLRSKGESERVQHKDKEEAKKFGRDPSTGDHIEVKGKSSKTD